MCKGRIVSNNLLTIENSEAERLELMRSLRDEGKSYREIADIVDCSVSTIHKYLAKLS
jgi:DNA-directed RNA polymerase specialized sigma24 family protein